jgi:hypothetical protein
MDFIVRIAAWAQTKYELGLVILNRLRRRLLLPLAHWGGRDMVLLKNGQWVDAGHRIPAASVRWRYNAEKHALFLTESEERTVRWPWLAASSGSADFSDFFGGLRIAAGGSLPGDKVISLLAAQKGVVPVEPIRVVLRTGEEEVLTAEGLPVVPDAAAVQRHVDSVNHIK